MRHGDKINNLGRTASHRRALLANLAINLIEHKRITTTLAKAKALRGYIEPLVTKAKDNTTHQRRIVFSYLQNKEAVKELFGTVAEKVGDRPGGYTRVIKLGFRRGDGAETAMIEFVDFNETYNPNAGKVRQQKKTRRGGKKAAAVTAEETSEATAVEEVTDAAEEAVETAADAVVAEAVAETVETAVEETVEAAGEEVAEAAEAAEEVVEAAAEEAAEAATEVVEEVAETTEEVVAEAADATEEAAEEKPADEEKKDGDA
ncbi:MAG: 50S ribosomal protein L17 [Lewinellaceae bacterium]|nr:50S ribosomal protein L17 [Saprospiraceae bacterium]MCB9344558.1 50S ribosomal protein L17 [Lewinellaceae bacterium]